MNYLVLIILWTIFCVIHSGMISVTITRFLKQKLTHSFRFYRLFFNIVSFVMLIPIIIYSSSIKEQPFFIWDKYLLPLKIILIIIGILLFILGSRHYSMSYFLGIAQINEKTDHNLINKTGELDSTGILGFIRHPYYAGIFPLIWSSDLDNTQLISNIILSIYTIIGTVLEERKLIIEFGDQYREYQRKVSMFFPIKRIIAGFRRIISKLKNPNFYFPFAK